MLDSCLYLEITTFAATRVVLFQILKFASFRSLNRARTHTHTMIACGRWFKCVEQVVKWQLYEGNCCTSCEASLLVHLQLCAGCYVLCFRFQSGNKWTPCEHRVNTCIWKWTEGGHATILHGTSNQRAFHCFSALTVLHTGLSGLSLPS